MNFLLSQLITICYLIIQLFLLTKIQKTYCYNIFCYIVILHQSTFLFKKIDFNNI